MTLKKKRILIVDDEEDLTWSISKGLSKEQNVFEVICTNSGNEALQILSKNPIDLLVTDIRMPDLSGLQLVDEVRQRYPKIGVIVMTAFGSMEYKDILERWKEMSLIEKPFEINDLRKLIYGRLSLIC